MDLKIYLKTKFIERKSSFGLAQKVLDPGKLRQGQASGMDWTLHTDLWKSETSRDIKNFS